MKETSIYIHIPFCDHKCVYCDFYSIIKYDNVEKYFNALIKEIGFRAEENSNNRVITSIFFGGGTPTFVHPKFISRVIDEIKKRFVISETAEITIEANPGTIDKQKVKAYLQSGINRISIGVQSFHEDELKFMTRIHDRQKAIDTVNLAHNSGFENISLDLIFNLPKQSKEMWLSNLETAVSLPIKHISAYSLTIENGTILNKMILDGKVKIQDKDFDAELYSATIEFLRSKSFYQYEVSNFSYKEYECRHNLGYWHYKDYFGFGTAAHSFVDGGRYWNVSSLNLYLTMMDEKGTAVVGNEKLNHQQQLSEFVMLALRSNGLNISEVNNISEEWFFKNKSYIDTLNKTGLVSVENNYIKFTPKGYAICDEIISKFI